MKKKKNTDIEKKERERKKMWARVQANIRDNIEEKKRDKKNYTQLGAQNEEKKIETHRATVDQGDKKKI